MHTAGAGEESLTSYSLVKKTGLLLGPVLLLWTLFTEPPQGLSPEGWRATGIGMLMAVWWITEALPLSVTALLPLLLVPTLSVSGIKNAAAPYASPAIFLFLGGFIIAIAMERWNLHRRIALNIVRCVGANPNAIVGGFMLATAFLSMWISNTATTVMMLPICLSVVRLMLDRAGRQMTADNPSRFAIAMMLGIAYAASIGGMATLIGTPPNAVLKGFLSETYGYSIDFVSWMLMAGPLVLVMLLFTWVYLTQVAYRTRIKKLDGARELIRDELNKLGPMSAGEIIVALVFVTTACLWIFRGPINSAQHVIQLNDASIAMFGAILMFAIPMNLRQGKFVLSWSEAERLPWGVLLLFGGGLSLAGILHQTGFAHWVGAEVSASVGEVSPLVLILLITAIIVFITEIMSNVAVVTAFLPVIAAVAIGFGQNPLLLAFPTAIAASCAFMMPVATPPNAIVFSSGYLRISHMLKAGLVLNLFAIAIIAVVTYYLAPEIFHITFGELPDWAKSVKPPKLPSISD